MKINCLYEKSPSFSINLYTSLGLFSRRHNDDIFCIFQENRLWHFFQIVSKGDHLQSPKETICKKRQSLFSGKKGKYFRMSDENFIQHAKRQESSSLIDTAHMIDFSLKLRYLYRHRKYDLIGLNMPLSEHIRYLLLLPSPGVFP